MLLEEYFYFSIIPFIDKLHQWINDFFSFFIDKMSVIYRNQVDLTFDAAGTNKKKLHSSPYIVRERRRRWFGYGSVMVRSWLDHGSVMARSWLDHGSIMVRSWLDHGSIMARSWLDHGSVVLALQPTQAVCTKSISLISQTLH